MPERELPPRDEAWTTYFSLSRAEGEAWPRFYIRDSRHWLFSYDGYFGGHDLLDDILFICEASRFSQSIQGGDSSMNIANRERFIRFLDGGLEIVEGNYLFGGRGQGAYLQGFGAFRWVLFQLGIRQPRKFSAETRKPDLADLNEQLKVDRQPFVPVAVSKPGG